LPPGGGVRADFQKEKFPGGQYTRVVMPGRWKERLEKLGRANDQARKTETRRLTLGRAARILEGLLSHPPGPPVRKEDPPVSPSRRVRRKHV
jgi:hypothetical protein